MSFKICVLGSIALLLAFTSCEGDKKKEEYNDLDRMAGDLLQTTKSQKIADDTDTTSMLR